MISSLEKIQLEKPSGPDGSILVPGTAIGRLLLELAPKDGREVGIMTGVGEVALPLLYWYKFNGITDNLALLQACTEEEFKTNQKIFMLGQSGELVKSDSTLNQNRLSLLKETNAKLLKIPAIGDAARGYLREHSGEYKLAGDNQGILAVLFGLSVEGVVKA